MANVQTKRSYSFTYIDNEKCEGGGTSVAHNEYVWRSRCVALDCQKT